MISLRSNFVFLIAVAVCLVAPFNMDVFLSGLPDIGKHFQTTHTSLILSSALLGIAVAQLFYGPLLDRYGRKPVLMIGLYIYTLASAVIMLTDYYPLFIAGRFVQAVGACSTITTVFAVARDVYDRDKLIEATSLIMAMIAIGPILAPLIGSTLNTAWGWRASFIFLFIIGCAFLVLVHLFFKETLVIKNKEALKITRLVTNYVGLIKTPQFLMYSLIGSFTYSLIFSYLNLSPLFIIEQMHYSLIAYGVIVALNALAIIGMATWTPVIAKKISLLKTAKVGFSVALIGGLLMTIMGIIFKFNLYAFILPMFVTTAGIGMIRPTASAGALSIVDHAIAGSAAALFNFISFSIGAVFTIISGRLLDQSSHYGLFIVFISTCALIILFKTKLQTLSTANEEASKM